MLWIEEKKLALTDNPLLIKPAGNINLLTNRHFMTSTSASLVESPPRQAKIDLWQKTARSSFRKVDTARRRGDHRRLSTICRTQRHLDQGKMSKEASCLTGFAGSRCSPSSRVCHISNISKGGSSCPDTHRPHICHLRSNSPILHSETHPVVERHHIVLRLEPGRYLMVRLCHGDLVILVPHVSAKSCPSGDRWREISCFFIRFLLDVPTPPESSIEESRRRKGWRKVEENFKIWRQVDL